MEPAGRLNIKMSSYQYRDPHVKDKNMGIPIPGKDGLYIETGLWILFLTLIVTECMWQVMKRGDATWQQMVLNPFNHIKIQIQHFAQSWHAPEKCLPLLVLFFETAMFVLCIYMLNTHSQLSQTNCILLHSEIISLPDNIFIYTGLNQAQGPHGKGPELRNRLTSRDASSKRPRFLGFFPQRGLKRFWPSFQGTQVISLGLGSPLTYITHTTPSPCEFGIRREVQNSHWE